MIHMGYAYSRSGGSGKSGHATASARSLFVTIWMCPADPSASYCATRWGLLRKSTTTRSACRIEQGALPTTVNLSKIDCPAQGSSQLLHHLGANRGVLLCDNRIHQFANDPSPPVGDPSESDRCGPFVEPMGDPPCPALRIEKTADGNKPPNANPIASDEVFFHLPVIRITPTKKRIVNSLVFQ